ncbi:toll-like receptor 7 [Clavelina lepadiformis]|uniref:toll-like receptor 7 n=1 Tax=Clavelina lepadiformis TaxID=159417 RepID=UPI004040F55B
MGWLLILLLKFLLFCRGSSRNVLNPCDEVDRVPGLYLRPKYTFSPMEDVVEKEVYLKIAPWLDRNFIYINCSWRGLTEVPQNLPTNVEALDLGFNEIRRITPTDFLSYPNITWLNFNANCVPVFYETDLPPCNGDLHIEPGALQNLLRLKFLGLAGSKLREFPRQLPTSIMGLDITFTLLGDVTAQLRLLSSLSILISAGNCDQYRNVCPKNFTITQAFSSSLQILDLNWNDWKMIPGYLLGNQLKIFTLFLNPFRRLRKNDFVNATSLEVLVLNFATAATGKAVIIEDGVFDPLPHLKYLNLSGNAVQFLPSGIFKNNKNLEILDLSCNSLKFTIFEPTYLVNLQKLRFVDLSTNNIIHLESAKFKTAIKLLRLGQTFASLSSLEQIYFGNDEKALNTILYSVQFHEIDNQSFANLSNLTHLSTIDISYCNVRHISSDAWSGLRHLKSILASNNQLTFRGNILRTGKSPIFEAKTSQKQFIFPGNLHEQDNTSERFKIPVFECDDNGLLDYSNNQITTISEQKEFLLSKTTILDLSHNQIRVIRSDDLRHLIYLCSIDLSHNPINRIDPFTYSSLSSLRRIDFVAEHTDIALDFNFLLYLNPSAQIKLNWRMPHCTVAILLDTISELDENTSLLELDIAQNDLGCKSTYKGKGLLKFMPKLKSLVLRNCKIVSFILHYTLQGLNHLEILDLSHNNLATFPSTSLKILNQLHSLNLDFNNIIELNGNLTVCPSLKHFTIAHNKIRFIQPGFFLHLKLETLDLSYNFINQLDSSIFTKDMLNSLQYLDIRWNELDCFCHEWQKFYRWYNSDASDNTILPGFYPECTSIIDQYYGGCVACHSPLNLRGRPVSRYGFNTSCDLQTHLKYTIAFTIFFVLFMLCGSVGYSKWFKRLIFRKVNEYFRVQALKPSDVSSRYSTNEGKKAFVFFDHSNDELGDWVDDKQIPGMINGNPSIELLLAGRDIDAGMSPNENLLRLITKSRKTIVIFSGNFCDTPTCKFVLQALQELQHSAGRDQLILVEWHGEVAARVPELIQRTFNRNFYNFLRFDETNDDEVMFFETLRTAFARSTALDD